MPEFTYSVQKAETLVDVKDFVAHCVDVPKFLAFCRECRNYDRRWSCPSFDFDPMQIWSQHRKLQLHARFLFPGAPDTGALLAALREEKDKFFHQLLLAEQINPGCFALAPGSCEICETCAKQEGKECRFPEQMRYSIEALGGDVSETVRRYLGREMQWIKDGVAPEYLTLVGGLLFPGEPA